MAVPLSYLPSLKKGQRVLGLFETEPGVAEWYPAVVQKVIAGADGLSENSCESYYLLFDDGDKATLSRLQIKLEGEKQQKSLCVGQHVLACCKRNEGSFTAGMIVDKMGSDNGEEVLYSVEFAALSDKDGTAGRPGGAGAAGAGAAGSKIIEKMGRGSIFGPHLSPDSIKAIQDRLADTKSPSPSSVDKTETSSSIAEAQPVTSSGTVVAATHETSSTASP